MADWAQIEQLCTSYRNKPTKSTVASLDKCLRQSEEFLDTLTRLFIQKQESLEEARAEFCLSEDGNYPEWACQYDCERKVFMINPIGVMDFYENCQNAPAYLQTAEGRGNGSFSIYRLNAYKAELRKLSPQLMLFLLIFQEVARALDITYVEHRRNTARREIEKSDMDYLNFLWAFHKLENLYMCLKGENLRSSLQFIWFESEWAMGSQ